jgi:hypothetical protein
MKNPVNALEEQLMKEEDLATAEKVGSYGFRFSTEIHCDECNEEIVGRHVIDCKMRHSDMWANMCPTCWTTKGSRSFGEGEGQLYSRTDDNKWLLTAGFCSWHLEDIE